MQLNTVIKYFLRFLLLQASLTLMTIHYFDNFLISNSEFKQNIYINLVEDANRFIPSFNTELISVDAFFILMIFVFLIILYSTKFYTYVNELSYSINKNLLDEYFQLYLLWTSYLFAVFYIFRFENISRGYLFVYSLVVPILLLTFRNTEFISGLLGRSITNETYISINLDPNSKFKNLRIMTFRKDIGNIIYKEIKDEKKIIDKIDKLNKKEKINLIVISLKKNQKINVQFEKYLINTNKKILIISEEKPSFKNIFLFREEKIENTFFTYFNNDIQYGAKFILKRFMDITVSLLGILIFCPVMLFLSLYILLIDGFPFFIKQRRVGLHGDVFYMYKFRSMKIDAHEQRGDLDDLNRAGGPLFKIEDDPRILKGLSFVRRFSLDEILQFFNVLKGDMSVVGPRPLFEDDTQLYDTTYMRRLNVLPGITGLLQINERNTSDFHIWYKYDIEYIENWSLYLDLKIILLTPFSMFSRKIRGV
tara:strand:- start:1175 stop:2611 length:1437 start_codon:yes stop_codon:yes gene_type:complete